MKIFIKIFTIAFLCFFILFSGLVWSFNYYMKDNHDGSGIVVRAEEEDMDNLEPEDIDILMQLVDESSRINFILLGLEGFRSDTMMFISFDPDDKQMDIVSIPRDTYYPRVGYDGPGKKKFNAVYGDHGAAGVKTAVSDLLLNVPVDHYVTVTYSGAEAIINSIGGVPVYISHLMDYEDPYDDPPLKIYFEPGNHLLNGKDGVKFLRYRKATPGSGGLSYADGDLGRIRAQQEFMKNAIKKTMSLRLPSVVTTTFRFVRTDIDLQDAIIYATMAVGMELENVNMVMLPGVARYQGGTSYFFHDLQETRDLLLQIYGYEEEETEEDVEEEIISIED
ncbi:LCP family protein [Alkaliphilus peptidifermentans]|uniref:Transcriptional attenuator, LytR family n=1 Tax=Alkaliphilus peptidifermentans DSM 18978 TaxID=1120976 RepID=A0A1G5AM73_9FIRM|nr:LCP family protein [Alkaliphilus peptidifermentans]SCX78935.1 transcriptional attenuator, LytR family [Alkaliphilus peptidifermentans DSM 18978]